MPPPPLPASLSARLQSQIDPSTGSCRYHPSVQLFELVQGGTRWVVRRKTCYKCGSRPGHTGSRHRPGVSVRNPRNHRGRARSEDGGRRGRGRSASDLGDDPVGRERDERRRSTSRSRSTSTGVHDRRRSKSRARRQDVVNPGTQRSGAGSEDEGRLGRGRSASVDVGDGLGESGRGEWRRSTSSFTGAHGRRRSRSRAQGRDMSRALAASAQRLHASERGRGPATPTERRNYHGRAAEFTQNVMEEANHPTTAIAAYVHPLTPRRSRPKPLARASVEEEREEFSESDPIITIPVIIGRGGATELPPPPSRSTEEAERHRERLQVRMERVRREREERRRRRGAGNAIVKSEPRGRRGDSKRRDERVTPTEIREQKSYGSRSFENVCSVDPPPREEKMERSRRSVGVSVSPSSKGRARAGVSRRAGAFAAAA